MSADVPGSFRRAWGDALADRAFRRRALVTLVLALIATPVTLGYLAHVEDRPGAVLVDPVLCAFRPVDVSAATFATTYGALILGVLLLVPRPDRLVLGVRAYALLSVARVGMMALTPLDPPATHVPLHDPFVGFLTGAACAPTRDLFFSGHTSLAFLLALVVPGPRWRAVFLGITTALAALVLLQHVHYTVDVVVAPFVAYGCLRLAAVRLPGE